MSRGSRVPPTRRERVVRAVYVLPSTTQPGLTEAERVALTVRNAATLTGRCACGATAPRPSAVAGQITHQLLVHEDACPAASPVLGRLAERLGPDLVYDLVPVEIEAAA